MSTVFALLHRRFWIVKLIGIAIVAQFLGSTASAVLGMWLMRSTTDALFGGEATATDADDEDDEDVGEPEAVLASAGARTTGSDPRVAKRDFAKRQLAAYNPFCPNCSPAAPVVTDGGTPVLASAVQSALPLRLNATMEAVDPALSLATIDDLERGIVGVYAMGDEIRPGVVLASVELGRVMVRRGNALERIELGVSPPAATPAPEAKPTAATRKPVSKTVAMTDDRVDCANETTCVVQRALIDEVFANPAAFATQAPRLLPAPDGGFKLSGVKGVVKQLGFKTGDRLLAVNGEELGGMDEAFGLVTKLRRASNVTVTIDRKGKTIDKQIEIKG